MITTLQGSAVVGEQTLVGFVHSLRRGENDVDGTVLVHTTLGTDRRYVQVILPPKDYEEAGLAPTKKAGLRTWRAQPRGREALAFRASYGLRCRFFHS
jgi:hypothetical protein